MSSIRISLQNVSFAYEADRKILHQINAVFYEKEAVGLIGANGVGKSTLLKLLAGLYTDYEGSIRVDELSVEKKTLPRLREKIGYCFQDADSQLFSTTVYEDVAFAPRNYGFSEAEVETRVKWALEQVRAAHLADKRIHRLSGGEKKLISIATVLSLSPDILLLDEPSITLDPGNRRNLIGILNSLPQLKIIAGHDLDFILDTCDRVILLHQGKIRADGAAKTVLADEELLCSCGLELPLSMSRRPAENV